MLDGRNLWKTSALKIDINIISPESIKRPFNKGERKKEKKYINKYEIRNEKKIIFYDDVYP